MRIESILGDGTPDARTLTVGIHPTEKEGFTARWEAALRARGVAVKTLDLLGERPLDQVAGCDGVMWHWAQYPHERRLAALPILRVIETHSRIPVFPDLATCWHFDDKIAQAYLLEALGIPAPKTWVFWRRQDALDWCEGAAYPLVAKLAVGAGSANVLLIRDAAAARRYVERCFSGSGILVRPPLPAAGAARLLARLKRAAKRAALAVPYVVANRFPSMPDRTYWIPQKNYALFQEFMPGNEFDTRVTVVGNRAFAYRRFNRPNDFRASGSGNFDVDPKAIDLRCVREAFESSRKLDAQSMAYDWLFRADGSGPVTGEISYGYVDWMIEKCPGHWDRDLHWHEGRLWPEEAHVDDYLARIRQGAGQAP
jgi:glutathione synthase/RimK-type ligase-like ATP-grasp enzyme